MVKPKLNKESLKIVVVLCCFALVSSLLLSLVYTLTRVDEQQRLMEAIGKSYESPVVAAVDFSSHKNMQYSQILNVFEAEDGALLILSKATKAYSADGIELVVIIKDDTIVGLIKYKTNETPGLGSKATEDSYLAKFVGLGVDSFNIDKETTASQLGVDIITGATKSSNAIRYSVMGAVAVYRQIKGEES